MIEIFSYVTSVILNVSKNLCTFLFRDKQSKKL
jgi:hypothetical protein